MKLDQLDYALPDDRIAQRPTAQRGQSRLLLVDRTTGQVQHLRFLDLPDLLRDGDLLIRNVSRVFPARLQGRRETGGHIEVLLLEALTPDRAKALVRPRKRLRDHEVVTLDGGLALTVHPATSNDEVSEVSAVDLFEYAESHGTVPLPPYIHRAPDADDSDRYQSVYAAQAGSVAAPTAGLHFDEAMFRRLSSAGVACADVLLHVGLGTFSPVRTAVVENHRMHSERFEVSAQTVAAIEAARQRNGRVVAIGTTTVRCLESAARGGDLQPASGRTDLFIYPGYEFQVIDALLTNFHQPRSTLLAMVAAFAGLELIQRAYAIAIENNYRFFSYGDAMLIL